MMFGARTNKFWNNKNDGLEELRTGPNSSNQCRPNGGSNSAQEQGPKNHRAQKLFNNSCILGSFGPKK